MINNYRTYKTYYVSIYDAEDNLLYYDVYEYMPSVFTATYEYRYNIKNIDHMIIVTIERVQEYKWIVFSSRQIIDIKDIRQSLSIE